MFSTEVAAMTQTSSTDEGMRDLMEGFERLETLFDRKPREDEDLSLCFLCLRWSTGDESCRREYRCELQPAPDKPAFRASGL